MKTVLVYRNFWFCLLVRKTNFVEHSVVCVVAACAVGFNYCCVQSSIKGNLESNFACLFLKSTLDGYKS